jgi:crotonobetainyl-CoA:carnitine CoA-transferase CaiB-like acyl-CoA transferase
MQYFTGLTTGTGVPDGDNEVYRHFTQMDGSSGNYCAQAILMALIARKRTGKGQLVELSMMRAASALQTLRFGEFLSGGYEPQRLGSAAQSTAPDRAYFCENQKYVGVSVTSEAEWQAFCGVIGKPELAGDERFRTNSDRVAHRKQLDEIIEPVFRTKPVEYWTMFMGRAGVPVGYPMSWPELRHHAQVRDNNYMLDVETAAWGEVVSGGPAYHLSKTPAVWFGTPMPGQHDFEIAAEIEASRAQGASAGSAAKREA